MRLHRSLIDDVSERTRARYRNPINENCVNLNNEMNLSEENEH